MANRKLSKALASQSNADYFAEVLKNSPKFASYTPSGTQSRLTKTGVEALDNIPEAKSEFFSTLLRVVWQKIDVARAQNDFERTGLAETWDVPYGEYTQRMSTSMVTPISPKYRGLVNGGSVDPYVIRKPELNERFFPLNYDYQSLISMQDIDFKRILLNEGQIGAVAAGIMEGLETGRIVQENLLIKNTLNQGINSKLHPLKSTQKYAIETLTSSNISDYTNDQLVDILVALGDIFSGMFAVDNPATGMFNAAGFKTRVESDQYVMLMRTGLKNRLNKITRAGTFSPKYLNLEIDDRIYDINDFGGLIPYAEGTHTTRLYPIFDGFGADTDYYITQADAISAGDQLEAKIATPNGGDRVIIGYQIAKPGIEAKSIAKAVDSDNIAPENWVDPNADIIAVIGQRGIMGINRQNGYTITPIYNPAGIYTNYWANSPNNGIYYDYYYNMIVITSNVKA